MKTALEELIDWCNDCLTDLFLSDGAKTALEVTITRATDLLEKEKEQIVNAYPNGIDHNYTDLDKEFGIGSSDRQNHGKQYYNQTYNKEVTALENK